MGKGYYGHNDHREQLKSRFNWGEQIARLDEDYCTLEMMQEDLERLESEIEQRRLSIPAPVLDLYDQERAVERLKGN
jgi:hypothetical protein